MDAREERGAVNGRIQDSKMMPFMQAYVCTYLCCSAYLYSRGYTLR